MAERRGVEDVGSEGTTTGSAIITSSEIGSPSKIVFQTSRPLLFSFVLSLNFGQVGMSRVSRKASCISSCSAKNDSGVTSKSGLAITSASGASSGSRVVSSLVHSGSATGGFGAGGARGGGGT